MTLTESQKGTILASLQAKIKGACPLCSHSNWTLGDNVVAATTTSLGGGMVIGGPFVPMVQLICTNCGFVAHHAIGALGIPLKD